MQIRSRKVSVHFQHRIQHKTPFIALLLSSFMLLCSSMLPATVIAQEVAPNATATAVEEMVAPVPANEVTVNAIISSQLISLTISQSEIARQHVGLLNSSLNEEDLPEARRHAEHIINTLDGESGSFFGDLDEDGQAQNPGDDKGVRAYLDEMAALFESAAVETVSTDVDGTEDISAALARGSDLVNEATTVAVQIFEADTITDIQLLSNDLTRLVASVYSQNLAVQRAITTRLEGSGSTASQRLDGATVQAVLKNLLQTEEEVALAVIHTAFLQETLTGAQLPEARQQAEHIINILDGENGILFGDMDRDGQIQNPGNGLGVRTYLSDTTEKAEAILDELNTIEVLQGYAPTSQILIDSLGDGAALMPQTFEQALLIIASETITEALGYAEVVTDNVGQIQDSVSSASESTRALIAGMSNEEAVDFPIPGISTVRPPVTGASGEVWQNPADKNSYIFVPAGGFTIGAIDQVGNAAANERPAHTIVLDAFWIAETETTNAQYGRCVYAGMCTPPTNVRWNQAIYAEHPVTHITWSQASIFARWAGGRLPSEGEWEKACRGITYRTYPWGNEAPSVEFANAGGTIGETTAVGSYPNGASRFGLLDMSGNVREWTASLDLPYPYLAGDDRENPTTSGSRIVRGGSYSQPQVQQRCTVRTPTPAANADASTGFRIVLGAGQNGLATPTNNAP